MKRAPEIASIVGIWALYFTKIYRDKYLKTKLVKEEHLENDKLVKLLFRRDFDH